MEKLFEKLGINEKGTKTFLKLLELGAQPISVLAKHVGIPRTTMYTVINELKNKQLIEEFDKNGVKFIKCIPVKNISHILKAKEKELEQILEILNEKLPELEAMENKLSITPHIKFYEGKNEVMKMYEEVLAEKKFYAYFNPELVKEIMPEYHYEIPESIKKSGGKAKELLVECAEAHVYQKLYNREKHQIKIMPKNIIFPSDTIITSEKIYIISYGEKQISATEIFNKSLAQTQRVIFEELWKKF